MALLMAANGILDPRGRGLAPVIAPAPVIVAFAVSYLWAALTPFIFWLSTRFSIERANWGARVLLLVGIGVLVAMGVEVVFGYLRFEVFDMGPRRRPGFNPLMGITRLFWLDDLIVYMAVLAAGVARDYFLRYRARQEEAVRLQAQAAQLQAQAAELHAQLAEARLSALRAQLNPHFLFNTLNAVSALVARDPRGVRRMIARLSELLRYSLEGAGEQEIPLRQELAFLERYVEIMQIRFQGRLEVHTEADADVLDALVPNLILQPLVENAIVHGASRAPGIGRVELRARRAGDDVVLSVRDNGPGPADADSAGGAAAVTGSAAGGVGLRNTRARLEQLYGAGQTLALRAAPGGGFIAEITFPYHTRADFHAAGVPAHA
jgi:signal transduction histidine kinase